MERALRYAATMHRSQERRASGVPYVQHAFAVAWTLDRLGFPEPVVIAGLLHDTVEDTEATLDEIESRFGATIATLVATLSERKHDDSGIQRPWIDRKREHLGVLGQAPIEARAIALADKYHNLLSLVYDLREGHDVWSTFHADREHVLWYQSSMIECCGEGEPRLAELARACRQLLGEAETIRIPGADAVADEK